LAKKTDAVIVTRDDFKPPNPISSAHIEELLEGYGIPDSKRSAFVDLLNELVNIYRDDIKSAQRHHREDVREELKDAANLLAKIQARRTRQAIAALSISPRFCRQQARRRTAERHSELV
jgi:hypothetical protein